MVAIKPKTPGREAERQRKQDESRVGEYGSDFYGKSFAYASEQVLEEAWRFAGRNSEAGDDKAVTHAPHGPLEKKRKYRDVLCLVLFGAFLVLMAVVAGYVLIHGSFSRLNSDNWGKCEDVDGLEPKAAPFKYRVTVGNISILLPGVAPSEPVTPESVDFFFDSARIFKDHWPNVVYMCLVALGLSLLMTGFLRIFAGVIIWMIIVMVIVTGSGISMALWVVYMNPEVYEVENVGLVLTGAITLSIVTTILILITIALRKRISLVVRLFKEAGKAVHAVPSVLLHPVWTFVCQLAVVCIFITLALLIETIWTTDNEKKQCQKPSVITYLRLLNVFAFFWMSQFVVACQHVVVAGAISRWFFTSDKRNLGSPLLVSFHNLVRYSLGSVAFGSLIISIVKFVRFIFNFLKKRCSGSGKLALAIKGCCSCCLWVLDKFLQFLCRNAYIEIAIYGYGFCPAAKRAFKIITTNALRLAAINSIGDFILFLAKLTIVALTTTSGFYIFQVNLKEGETLKAEWGLLVIGASLSFYIAHCFISIYEMTVDTIFICFCEDYKMNDGHSKPYFMSKGLMEFVKTTSKQEKKY